MTDLILAGFHIWIIGAALVAVIFLVLTIMSPLPPGDPERTTAVMLVVACLWPIAVPLIVAMLRDLGKWR